LGEEGLPVAAVVEVAFAQHGCELFDVEAPACLQVLVDVVQVVQGLEGGCGG
jgi:hypothetical protein